MDLLKITNAEVVSSNKRERISGGLYIDFLSFENLVKGDNLQVMFEDDPHYFEVTDISIAGENLNVKAREVGYWATKFDHQDNFDLRKIIGLEVAKITDEDHKKQIYQMSCWC